MIEYHHDCAFIPVCPEWDGEAEPCDVCGKAVCDCTEIWTNSKALKIYVNGLAFVKATKESRKRKCGDHFLSFAKRERR
jgi:hypothetical protein